MSDSPAPPSRRDDLMCGLFVDLQNARFNFLYHQALADRFDKLSKWSRIVAAIAASGVLGGILSQGSIGAGVWKGVTALAAVAAIIGPLLGWERKAHEYQKMAFGFSLVHDRLKGLLADMKLSDLSSDHEARKAEIMLLWNSLSALVVGSPNKALIESSWDRANEEYPPTKEAWGAI